MLENHEKDNFAFTAVLVEDPEGGYSAFVEEITAVNTQAKTMDEARSNLQEALKMVMKTNKILSEKSIIQGLKSYREPLSIVG
jgi:predicted RNase H-like HicB family nuclease